VFKHLFALLLIPLLLAACQSSYVVSKASSTEVVAQLGQSFMDPLPPGFAELRQKFEDANPSHHLDWQADVLASFVEIDQVAFVQSGEGLARFDSDGVGAGGSPIGIGDVLCMRAGQKWVFDAPMDLLVFTLPRSLNPDLPAVIRPDWDEKITDTPGGCATEGDAYRRICLTWLGKNGPYLSEQINAHRVRIHDSFTHYHPVDGGFDEFYLVQEAPPGARLILSDQLHRILNPAKVSPGVAATLLREIPLHVGDLIYLPRGVVHRGVGGAVVQVITVPGFVPNAEIAVDQQINAINDDLHLPAADQLPFHRGPEYVTVEPHQNGEVQFLIGGKAFTTLRLDRRHPDLWPIFNADSINVTRRWPRAEVAGEKQDHPHHQSLWFAHGAMAGLDFWHSPLLKVQQAKLTASASGDRRGWVETTNQWLDGSGQVVLQDSRRIAAYVDGRVRGLDFEITLEAQADMNLGDTKEGTFALRVANGLVADLGGSLSNDVGAQGKAVWGKAARWIQASGEIDGKPVAVVMAGHRDNLRHPTTWHARNYGLLAANPFGLKAFGQEDSGALQMQAGETLQLRYRVLIFAEPPTNAQVEELLEGFSSESRP
jgi:hypothetical protein